MDNSVASSTFGAMQPSHYTILDHFHHPLRADCGSDHELLIAKFRLKLKKVGKTTKPFRYDLNHILYDYTVEVTKRLDW